MLQATAGDAGFAEFEIVRQKRCAGCFDVDAAKGDVIEGGGVDADMRAVPRMDSARSTRCTIGTPPRYIQ